jgi:alkylated DNA nucleotide flippase Atl1
MCSTLSLLDTLNNFYVLAMHMKQEIYTLVQEIPRGKVTSYGLVAEQLDMRYDIKTSGYIVGRMLSTMSEVERKAQVCPWQRVINKQ